MISFDEFKKLDIRVGKIVAAEKIPGSEKLIKLLIDLGETEPRQIVAGIGPPAGGDVSVLIGKEIPVIANLEPKTFLGTTSFGMLLAADKEGSPVLLHPAEEVPPGSIVK
jgi:methionine--tRNA ligase beta chain